MRTENRKVMWVYSYSLFFRMTSKIWKARRSSHSGVNSPDSDSLRPSQKSGTCTDAVTGQDDIGCHSAHTFWDATGLPCFETCSAIPGHSAAGKQWQGEHLHCKVLTEGGTAVQLETALVRRRGRHREWEWERERESKTGRRTERERHRGRESRREASREREQKARGRAW